MTRLTILRFSLAPIPSNLRNNLQNSPLKSPSLSLPSLQLLFGVTRIFIEELVRGVNKYLVKVDERICDVIGWLGPDARKLCITLPLGV